MSNDVLAVLTYKSVQTCLEVEGGAGTQSWRLVREHAQSCRYVVLCRNAKHPHVEGREPHKSAFLIGRVSDVVPSTETEGRWLVRFDEYALLPCIPDAFKGGRNPVSYTTLEALGIDLDKLEFKAVEPVEIASQDDEEEFVPPSRRGLTIAQAKAGLASTFGVPPEAVEITIRA